MSKGSILVTGGAGYIGSHAVLALREAGESVVVLDDLSTGNRNSIAPDVPFVEGDVADGSLVRGVIEKYGVDAVMHFAGSIIVSESVADPLKYYRNNVCAGRNLIEACASAGVKRFIFSSTATVYGGAYSGPIPEDADTRPEHAYGTSKLITEWMLRDMAIADPDFRYVALRYFNVAGADPQGRAGQSTENSTLLIKVASEAVVGLREKVLVFGEDYETRDGTCIRDYIHVTDLVDAHLLALEHLRSGGANEHLNCGYGHGYSVLEVLDAVRRNGGENLVIEKAPRRPGDVPVLVADVARIKERFGWRPQHDDIDETVRSAIGWERKLRRNRT